MPEPLTSQLVAELLQELQVNFPGRRGDQDITRMVDVYRNGLNGLSGDSVRFAVKRCIQEDEYFPKVARLRDLAGGWLKTHATIPAAPSNELYCATCRTEATYHKRWRPKVDRKYRVLVDAEYLLLESYERLLCQCAAPCHYTPIAGVEPPCMLLSQSPAANRTTAGATP